ncbi:MAG TPA: outer membrane protein assembly factor BamD [Bacteroidales bacterium]
MRFRLYIVLIILVLLSSCGEYEKLLKSSDFDLKKSKAKEYYDAGQYVKTTELLTQILPRYRATEEAEDLNWMNAQSYFGMRDFIMAGSYYKSFVEQFPFGKHAEEANYKAALCDYNVSSHPELDQENTRSALEGFKIFINKFPNSTKVEESKKMINDLEEKLVEKSYLSAKLYYDMRQYKAAVVALTNSLKEYSNSKYREKMMYLKLNSLFQYAELSFTGKQKERYQATLDDYYSFMEEFPKSTYTKGINSIYQKTNKYLKAGIPESGVK